MSSFFHGLHLGVNLIGNYASVIGLLVSIGGFIWTIIAVNKSKKAVSKVKINLRRGETVSDISAALSALKEIKRIHRSQSIQYQLLAERYSELRSFLNVIKANNPVLGEQDVDDVVELVTQLNFLEKSIDREIAKGSSEEEIKTRLKSPKSNEVLSEHFDIIQSILIRLRNEAEE